MDNHKNFAVSTVLIAPSPAASGTSLTIQSGDASKFSTSMNCTVWPAGEQPLANNAEIVRITNIVGDTLTIQRTQESTSARTIIQNDNIANTVSVKVLTDIEASLSSSIADIATIDASLTSHIANVSNPHSVTKTQLSLGNVDNTTDLNKPISTATQTALDSKIDVDSSYINVKDYGAVGNGSTNDSTAIQSALDAMTTGGELMFPQGTYIINATLLIPTGIKIRGLGTAGDNRTGAGATVVLKAKTNLNSAMINMQSSYAVQFDNIQFDANGSNQTTAGVIISGIDYTAERFLGTYFYNCAFINTKIGRYAIEYKTTTGIVSHIKFFNCLWYNNGSGAFQAVDRVVWPEFINCNIYYNTAASSTGVLYFANSNCNIQNCNVESNTGINIRIEAGATVTDTCLIQNCDIESVVTSDILIHCLNTANKVLIQNNQMNVPGGIGIKMEACIGWIASGNIIISDTTAGDGILVTGASSKWNAINNVINGYTANIEVTSGSNYYIISYNNLNGVAVADAGGGANKIVGNNL